MHPPRSPMTSFVFLLFCFNVWMARIDAYSLPSNAELFKQGLPPAKPINLYESRDKRALRARASPAPGRTLTEADYLYAGRLNTDSLICSGHPCGPADLRPFVSTNVAAAVCGAVQGGPLDVAVINRVTVDESDTYQYAIDGYYCSTPRPYANAQLGYFEAPGLYADIYFAPVSGRVNYSYNLVGCISNSPPIADCDGCNGELLYSSGAVDVSTGVGYLYQAEQACVTNSAGNRDMLAIVDPDSGPGDLLCVQDEAPTIVACPEYNPSTGLYGTGPDGEGFVQLYNWVG